VAEIGLATEIGLAIGAASGPRAQKWKGALLLSTFNLQRTGGLAARPRLGRTIVALTSKQRAGDDDLDPVTISVFNISEHLGKADRKLIGDDEHHLAATAIAIEQSIADVSDRVEAARRESGGTGQEAMDRDVGRVSQKPHGCPVTRCDTTDAGADC